MGKRKHKKDSRKYAKKKWRRLEEHFRKFLDEYSSSSDYEDKEDESSRSETDTEEEECRGLRSVVAEVHPRRDPQSPPRSRDSSPHADGAGPAGDSSNENNTDAPIQNTPSTLPANILDALGDPKGKPEKWGSKIQEKISERWGRILSEGLNKDHKQALLDKVLVPENFPLVKAPKLNQEIAAFLTESARNRDKRLEQFQQQLGLGIANLTNTITVLINHDAEKVDLIKQLSETNQILLDLHYENTVNRQKLITPTLDKKFLNLIQDTKRDSFLFGEGLGDKIKAVKTAQNSGLQLKKKTDPMPSKSQRNPQQGNWKGPPRQGQRTSKAGRGKYRYNHQSTRRTGSSYDREQSTTKTSTKPTTKKN